MHSMKTTQQNIQALRASGLSQQEIAAEVSKTVPVDQVTICRWEHGDLPKSLEVAEAIAELLKVTRRKWRRVRFIE